MKLIAGWKQSYRLYSVQIAAAIMLLSVIDSILRVKGIVELPAWVYTVSSVLLIVVRNVQQFFESADTSGNT
ncbi:MAG: hypothetical protein GAK30_01586 [Paracidovorax wautersii]|uniref:Holin n=1 Tax=Paracidovorax wautersii TaxID=1177982 RepID=A0A7V8JQW8_9BURK|nr:MAG: hypothetical protein GAK30_01586 [Paracidovorax wautersii]